MRQQHILRNPDPLEAPFYLTAGPARHFERLRVPRLDPLISAYIHDHRRTVHAAHEVVRRVPKLTRAVVPVQPVAKRLDWMTADTG